MMPSPHWTPTPAATEVDAREMVPDGVSATDAAATRQQVSTLRARERIVRYAWSMIRSFRTGYQQSKPSATAACPDAEKKGRQWFCQRDRRPLIMFAFVIASLSSTQACCR